MQPGGRAPRVTGRRMVAALKRAGWTEVRHAGSHVQLAHAERSGIVTVPIHAGETLHPKVFAGILKQAGLSVDELRELL